MGPGDGPRHPRTAGADMLASGFGFLAIFSLITILFGEAARRGNDPLGDEWFLNRYTRI